MELEPGFIYFFFESLFTQLCPPTLCEPWTIDYQASPSTGFSRQKYWSGFPFPSPEDLPNPGIEPGLPHCRQILYHLSHEVSLIYLVNEWMNAQIAKRTHEANEWALDRIWKQVKYPNKEFNQLRQQDQNKIFQVMITSRSVLKIFDLKNCSLSRHAIHKVKWKGTHFVFAIQCSQSNFCPSNQLTTPRRFHQEQLFFFFFFPQ